MPMPLWKLSTMIQENIRGIMPQWRIAFQCVLKSGKLGIFQGPALNRITQTLRQRVNFYIQYALFIFQPPYEFGIMVRKAAKSLNSKSLNRLGNGWGS